MDGDVVYVCCEREFLRLQEPVFKVGFSGNVNTRAKQYPKGTVFLATAAVTDGRRAEAAVLSAFKRTHDFTWRTDFGNEYFECVASKNMKEAAAMAMHILTATASAFVNVSVRHITDSHNTSQKTSHNTSNKTDRPRVSTIGQDDIAKHMADFVHSCLEPSMPDSVSLTDLFQEIRAWIRDSDLHVKVPKKRDLRQYMDDMLGLPTMHGDMLHYNGWRIRV